jgi:nicotinate-nucleotide pyrophosphorylase (carboxylating)
MTETLFLEDLELNVKSALAEDIGSGDISVALLPEIEFAQAEVICRDAAVICGRPWVDEVFRQVCEEIELKWSVSEGSRCEPGDLIFMAYGPAKHILSAERTALNFLQVLSATTTSARAYAELVEHTAVKILDTRKTLPGLRRAQKYAVLQGRCYNHRLGLYDAFLLKENHIAACGGIAKAIASARQYDPAKPVEIEVESLDELEQAIMAGANIVMLDNFSLHELKDAVTLNKGRVLLEASGGYNLSNIVPVAETGVDYISVGSLTKHCHAVDFSMRFK